MSHLHLLSDFSLFALLLVLAIYALLSLFDEFGLRIPSQFGVLRVSTNSFMPFR